MWLFIVLHFCLSFYILYLYFHDLSENHPGESLLVKNYYNYFIIIIINELHRAGPNNFTTRSMLNISVSRLLNHSLRNSPPLTRTPENWSLRRVQTREKGSAAKEIGDIPRRLHKQAGDQKTGEMVTTQTDLLASMRNCG